MRISLGIVSKDQLQKVRLQEEVNRASLVSLNIEEQL